ncbi:hypothetical protein Cni_G20244 [Canna indica]|uniref:Uncharacterized protein n=1 Tax=Canna indica TaxID=4628 RepID=A0AAQ3QG08_9LILI|nr:hypothetical protein Cni_G20244 [Canna indica]
MAPSLWARATGLRSGGSEERHVEEGISVCGGAGSFHVGLASRNAEGDVGKSMLEESARGYGENDTFSRAEWRNPGDSGGHLGEIRFRNALGD